MPACIPSDAEEALAEAHTLEELETLACGGGCGLAVVGWPDHADEPLTDIGSAAAEVAEPALALAGAPT